VAWRIERPAEIQAEIDELNRRVRQLEALTPIVGLRVRRLTPVDSREYVKVTPAEWWEQVRAMHGRHWHECPGTPNGYTLDVGRYILAREAHPLRCFTQGRLA